MLVIASGPRRPLGLSSDTPILANPPAVAVSPDLARIMHKLGTDDIETAWEEYHRRVDDFKTSPLGIRIAGLAGYTAMDERASGISADEYDLLDAAYRSWVDSLIDHAELLRREMKHCREVLAGDVVCGYCGTRFLDHAAMIAHTSHCGEGHRDTNLGIEWWRTKQ